MLSDLERRLIDQIRADPDRDDPRLIYADWLEHDGQSERAELIRVQCALQRLEESDSRRVRLAERERELLELHEASWVGPFAPYVTPPVFHRGMIDRITLTVDQFLMHGQQLLALAPIRKVRIIHAGRRLAELVAAPPLRLVRELDLSMSEHLGDGKSFRMIGTTRLNHLQALDLGFTDLTDRGMQALAATSTFPNLTVLRLSGNTRIGSAGFQALAESPLYSSLVELDLTDCQLDPEALAAVWLGPWAERLERVHWNGNRLGDAGTGRLARSALLPRLIQRDGKLELRQVQMGPVGIEALATSSALTGIRHLDLAGNRLGDEGLATLAASTSLRGLRVLNLSANRISERGVQALARSPLLASLERIDLTGNLIGRECIDRLSAAAARFERTAPLTVLTDTPLMTRGAARLLAAFVRRHPPTV